MGLKNLTDSRGHSDKRRLRNRTFQWPHCVYPENPSSISENLK